MNEKVYLVKMLLVKADEARDGFKKMRNTIDADRGASSVDRSVLSKVCIDMQNENENTHRMLQEHETETDNLFDVLKHLCDVVESEREESRRYYYGVIRRTVLNEQDSAGREIEQLNRKLADLEHDKRILEENFRTNGAPAEVRELAERNAELSGELNRARRGVEERDRDVDALNAEVMRLRNALAESGAVDRDQRDALERDNATLQDRV